MTDQTYALASRRHTGETQDEGTVTAASNEAALLEAVERFKARRETYAPEDTVTVTDADGQRVYEITIAELLR